MGQTPDSNHTAPIPPTTTEASRGPTAAAANGRPDASPQPVSLQPPPARRTRPPRKPPDGMPTEAQGQDAVGSRSGRGANAIPWRRNLWAMWAAQMLAIIAFSLRVPYLPFFLGDLGVRTTEGQALWSGIINAAGAGIMAIS